MEFKFNVNKLLPRKINKVTHNLVPEDFKGDRRELNECQRLLSRILDDMGEASARAQGLNKPITSALKLRDTDHTIYLLVDNQANNGLGSVVGLLKTGSKNLFLFDEMGEHYQLQARCILDFYVHESRQRMGLGNTLYQHMLSEENLRPVKLAIDRPSEKFLAFLRKYYGLSKIIPQNNKFVVFEGFFNDESRDVRSNRYSLPPRMSLDDGTSANNNDNNGRNGASLNGVPYVASVSRSSFGRYAAARPPCSMANIIHNTAMLGQSAEHTGPSHHKREEEEAHIINKREEDEGDSRSDASPPPPLKLERPRSLSLYSEEEQKQRSLEMNTVPTPVVPDNQTKPFVPVLLEPEKTEKNVKPSPSCGQEVATGTNQHGHLDLKFYHSPLW
ncbi:PREDICTED: alpha-tubulin N-acetyltransferase-like isoform X2 [Wasmannia auropunctata]|uniref:alpha-tubulin N-acetyltransferase-like isoform X2 n=1 Tax=Wasmannia auropunctata TaxID=64793 RepID=UPI0005EFC7C4|nr:PREDICTED: alpha-tubulin N-acetyltransferase-like isoform X2 [Wasmannia auropunctata]